MYLKRSDDRFHEAQAAFRAALCDSFNTPEALDVLRDLVSRTYVYINSRGTNIEISVVERIARWIGQTLRMFGLGEGDSTEIGWGQEISGEGNVNVRFHLLHHGGKHPHVSLSFIARGDLDAIPQNLVLL